MSRLQSSTTFQLVSLALEKQHSPVTLRVSSVIVPSQKVKRRRKRQRDFEKTKRYLLPLECLAAKNLCYARCKKNLCVRRTLAAEKLTRKTRWTWYFTVCRKRHSAETGVVCNRRRENKASSLRELSPAVKFSHYRRKRRAIRGGVRVLARLFRRRVVLRGTRARARTNSTDTDIAESCRSETPFLRLFADELRLSSSRLSALTLFLGAEPRY